MTIDALAFLNDALVSAGVNYEFMEYTSDVTKTNEYWVGSYSEVPPAFEDGEQETQFILTGFSKGSWLNLEQTKAKIEELFPKNGGKTAILSNRNGIAVFFGNSFPVPTGIDELKRLQVNLTVKEWVI